MRSRSTYAALEDLLNFAHQLYEDGPITHEHTNGLEAEERRLQFQAHISMMLHGRHPKTSETYKLLKSLRAVRRKKFVTYYTKEYK